ncbi:PREDICTED: WRKY transcription factor 22 [Nelumbo nucifera]|uniref:WRKY domain-containing protein n=2 Tax=Nelumbo nucifera TaxID=4432 RepID=A0A822ZM05_NELNU|nr:PREDICTED: WRKY transcription factor 22 [Nelumbo nucifera]DAD47084.1 TPA_asm: hypothetical protein HUJ06_017021 [Nelumbo nucifera]
MEVDWDLQAVVRGCAIGTTPTTTATFMEDPLFCFSPSSGLQQDDHLHYFSDPFQSPTMAFEELEDLYKPFFPKFEPLSPQTISHTSFSAPLGGLKDQQQQQQIQPQLQQRQQQQQKQPQVSLAGPPTAAVSSTTTAHSQTPRSKRRKNQQKRVVCQVPAEGLSSDMWAWRKYGQKPIKGSPYPRGYYRCSSSKGCLARKQVERSRTDPGMFIITYTAEHNHPLPTHRNSLAGSTRQKFPTSQRPTTGEPDTSTTKPSCASSPTSGSGLSPTTPLTTSMEDELLQPIKQESQEDDGEEMVEDDEDDESLIPDMVINDDFFMGLEEIAGSANISSSSTSAAFEDCFSDHLPASFPLPWHAHNAATTAGGI